MTIGEKIKTLRTKACLTQKEVCGDFMTRNMLSRIESGSALPSLATLCYLADKFEVDPGYLISREENTDAFVKLQIIGKVRKLYESQEYKECLALIEGHPCKDVELSLYYASCALLAGKDRYAEGDFEGSLDLFQKGAERLSGFPICRTLSEIFDCLIQKCKGAAEQRPFESISLPENSFTKYLHERLIYDFLLKLIKTDRYEIAAQVFDQLKISNPLLRKHINARLSMASSNHARARTLLSEIVSSFDGQSGDLPFKYLIYSDLEISCKAIGDYEGAYTSAIEKNNLASILKIK